jgi:hypothetical protein
VISSRTLFVIAVAALLTGCANAASIPLSSLTPRGPVVSSDLIPILPASSLNLESTTASGLLTYIQNSLALGSAASYNVGTSGNAVPLLNQINTWSANQIFAGTQIYVGNSSSFGEIDLTAAAGNTRDVLFLAGIQPRWSVIVQDAEGGSNSGANFYVERFADGGGYLDNPIAISRATGLATFSDGLASGASVSSTTEVYPGTGSAAQTAAGLLAGTGNPGAGVGNNGDFYFRADCIHGFSDCVWHKESGSWYDVN